MYRTKLGNASNLALNMFDIMQYTIILISHFMNGYVKDLVCLNFSNDHAALIPCFK